ncbi:tyrosine-type recombinase/integrase [Blastopirellula marina]|uniref:tyrosine-type recombinase/integrase n=1 Tax=Blastopirellula marina TaxID=124 RepID=UPI001375F42B|nr:site-specific integrase [Blastopirellula marina]
MKVETEARLVLGINVQSTGQLAAGPEMDWDSFREQYRVLHLATVRDKTAMAAESRLDIAERILKPKCLGDIADSSALQNLQVRLLAGDCSARKRPRSPHTVKGYMAAILATLNWAHLQGWLPNAPKIRLIKTSKNTSMKGRPITETEYKAMLKATPKVVGDEAAESWLYVLRALWESALRLEELMHVSWNKPGTIRPVWETGKHPILDIPASMQKNDTDQTIPLLPGFEALLLKTPEANRTGWAFNPESLQLRLGRKVKHQRPDAEWVGKVISRIGKEANIIVADADKKTGRPVKYASAHDLRRSCGNRLRNAGVPPLVISRVMRHASWETTRKHYAPGDVQKDAEILRNGKHLDDSLPK